MLQMRAAAQVLPIAVPVHPQWLITWNGLDQLDLIRLAGVCVMLDRAAPVPNLGAHWIALVDDFFHLLFNRAQIFGGEGLGAVKVVIPAILDHGADGNFGVGPDLLHRAGHDMGQVVAYQLVGLLFVLHGVDRDLRVGFNRPLHIPMRAVDGGANGLFRQRFGNAFRNRCRGHTGFVFARIAIGEGQRNLGHVGLLVSLAPTKRPVAGM